MHQRERRQGFGHRKAHAVCTYCGKDISDPILKVQVGKRLRNVENSIKKEDCLFHSAADLYKEVEKMIFDHVVEFQCFEQIRRQHKPIFWNLIYYFSEYQLPFDFLLEYDDTKMFDE
jgi:hypothetical protein